MNHGDIKPVIDQLDQVECVFDYDEPVVSNASLMLETLGNQLAEKDAEIARLKIDLADARKIIDEENADHVEQIAAQELVIDRLKDELFYEYVQDCSAHTANLKIEALSMPSSTEHLEAWYKDMVNLNGYSYSINDNHVGFSVDEPPEGAYDEGSLVPLYAIKPFKEFKCN